MVTAPLGPFDRQTVTDIQSIGLHPQEPEMKVAHIVKQHRYRLSLKISLHKVQ